jgi:hypothetical protein
MTTFGQINLFNPILNNIDRAETKRYAGMGRSIHFPEAIVSEACSIVMLEKHVKTVWTLYEYDCTSGCINGDYKIVSKGLLKHLSGSKQIILMSATVGEGVEAASKKYFEQGEYALGLLIDAAATAAVEQAADALCNMLSGQFENKGSTLTSRFSPGYGDWALEEQEQVAPLAHVDAIGVHLTNSKMLIPRKSITAVVGLRTANAKDDKTGCSKCTQKDCIMRRIK